MTYPIKSHPHENGSHLFTSSLTQEDIRSEDTYYTHCDCDESSAVEVLREDSGAHPTDHAHPTGRSDTEGASARKEPRRMVRRTETGESSVTRGGPVSDVEKGGVITSSTTSH